jgi:hypothetical protein
MAIVQKVELKLQTSLDITMKYQIITYCFLKDILISNSDLKFLTELAKTGKIELTKFCKSLVEKQIFKSPQSARNAITKAEKKELLFKEGINKKTIMLNKDINVQTEGVVLLDYKVLGRESKES